jgi:sugar lactone lactonase YvrE
MSDMTVETVAEGLTLPEGARWHDGALWFSDMHANAVLRLPAGGELEMVAKVPGHPSGLGFLPDGRPLIVSMHDRKLLRLDPDGLHEHADLSLLAAWHCNDMTVDASGRAYVGNFGDASVPPAAPAPTVLIMVESDGAARVVADDLWFPNGIALTPDGGTLIVAETRSSPGRLTAFTVEPGGDLRDRRVLIEFAQGEMPDGIAMDGEAGIWAAMPFSNEVVHVTATGELDRRLPFTGPYAVALGGPDGRDLFVCTAPTWVPEQAKRLRAGAIRRTRVDVASAS